ncbi:MAG TPA: hypothetical protein VKP67_23780 [Xanthobacteraceae bacterium]|nr:hypothetical protein [Xanthobacteraceae bacterium]
MTLGAKNITAQIARVAKKTGALLARYIRRLVEARKRRVMSEQEFRRTYEAHCRANGLRPAWVEDWKGWRQL